MQSSQKPLFLVWTLLTAALLLPACQSSTQAKCRALNWRLEGESLALSGSSKTRSLEELTKQCKGTFTQAELQVFGEGFERGLALLCSAERGFDYGETGNTYKNTCPDFRESDFLKGYYKGRLIFLEKSLTENEDLYRNSEERVWRKEREYTILRNQDPERAKLEADVLESYREEARSLALRTVELKKEVLKMKKLSAESFF